MNSPSPAADRPVVAQVRDLHVDFWVNGTWYPAVIGATFDLHAGEALAIVGESGSGKSTIALAMMGLLPKNASIRGSIRLGDREVVGLDKRSLRSIRGSEVSMIFQEPMTALNPVYTVGFQIAEMLRSHQSMSPKMARQRAIELLKLVEIPEPERRVDSFPHQLSGGQRQRAMIAQALACDPKLLVADEPTTALDVTVQAEILKLVRDLRDRIDAGIVLITHDMGVVADLADRVMVMEKGLVVEQGPIVEVFNAPQHAVHSAAAGGRAPPRLHRHQRGAVAQRRQRQRPRRGAAGPDGARRRHRHADRGPRRRPPRRGDRVPEAGPGPGVPRRRRRQPERRARRGRRARRRVRLGQDDDRPGHRRAAAVRRGRGDRSRHEHGRHLQERPRARATQRELRVPGPGLVAQPPPAGRGVDRGTAVAGQGGQGQGAQPPSRGSARPGPPVPPPPQPLPARVVGWAASACRHRPGARPRAQAADRRRADVGARRVRPGPGARPLPGAAGRRSASPACSSPTTSPSSRSCPGGSP